MSNFNALIIGGFSTETFAALRSRIEELAARRGGSQAHIQEATELAPDSLPDELDLVVAQSETTERSPVEGIDVDAWARGEAIDALGTWVWARELLPRLEPRKGSLVVATTRAAEHPVPFGGTLSTGKAFEASFIRNLAVEVASRGVALNLVRTSPTLSAHGDNALCDAVTYLATAGESRPVGTTVMADGLEGTLGPTAKVYDVGALPRPRSARAERGTRLRAVITGGGGEIGKASALALHEMAQRDGFEGLDAVLADNDPARLALTVAELTEHGIRCESMIIDAGGADAGEKLVDEAVRSFGGLDLVFANAAKGVPDPASAATRDAVRAVFELNVRATALLARAAASHLERSGGSLIATSSIGGLVTGRNPVYAASKAGLVMLVRQLALEWARRGVRANIITPGSTETPMNSLNQLSEAQREAIIASYPTPRNGTPEEVANAVSFLASRRASYVTGQAIIVDGGLVEWMR